MVLVHDKLYAFKDATVFFGIDISFLPSAMFIDEGHHAGLAGNESVVRGAEVVECGGSKLEIPYKNFVCEQDFVWGLIRNHFMGVNHMSPRHGRTGFNKRARHGDRLYGVAHLSRVARPLRAAEKRNKSSKKKKDEYDKTEKKGKIQMNKKRLGACWSEVLLTFFFYDPFFGHKLNKPLTRKVGGR